MDSGLAGWRTCFEPWLEPRAAGLPKNNARLLTRNRSNDSPSDTLGGKGVARLSATIFAAAGQQSALDGNSPLHHRHVVSAWASWRPRFHCVGRNRPS